MKTKRISRPAALGFGAVLVFASPAMASLVVESFIEADIGVGASCLIESPGPDVANYTAVDADDPNATLDGTGNTVQIGGQDLAETQVSVRGMIGDRVMYTDLVRYENNCGVDMSVALVSGTEVGDWTGLGAEIHLSSVAAPGTRPGGAGWAGDPITVTSGGLLTNTRTGSVVIPAGESRVGAVVITAGVGADQTETNTISWTIEATNG